MSARSWLIGLMAACLAGAPSAMLAQEAKAEGEGKKEKGEAKPAKAKEPKARSFTDEDLKKYHSKEGDTSQESAPSTAASRPSRYGEGAATANDEEAWKRRAANARQPLTAAESRVRSIEAQMNDLREQLNPMSTRYILGGNSNAGPGQVYEIEQSLRGLEAELKQAKAALAEAEKAWQTFVDDARGQGASSAWLEP